MFTANRKQLGAKFQSALGDWTGFAGLACLAAAGVMFFVGASELPQVAFGYPPSSVYGLWSVAAVVAFSGHIADRLANHYAALRMQNYGSPPPHRPSIVAASVVGGLAFLTSWEGTLGRHGHLEAASSGIISGLLVYLTVGRVWRASSFSEWTRKNAHAHRLTRYVVEGRSSPGAWTLVGCVDDVMEIQRLRVEAHTQFDDVRFWRVESYVTLMRSDAAPNLMLATPVDAADVSEKEARKVGRM